MKHMNLNEADRQLLLNLHTFVYLHKDFIIKHIYTHYKSEQVAYRRLNQLETNGYLKSFFLPINHEARRPSKVYTLNDFGVQNVEQLRGLVHWRKKWTESPAVWYQHQLLLAESAKAFENAAPQAGLEVMEYISEVRGFYEFPKGTGKTSIRPDGIVCIGLEKASQMEGLILEMERSYTTREKSIMKMEQYNEFFNRSEELMEDYQRKVGFEYPVTDWTILFIGGTQAKTEKLLRDLSEEKAVQTTLVAYKGDVEENPFGEIYRNIEKPDVFRSL